ncbi:hypothetical protein R6Q59_018667 [Mikania micrantha]
MNIPTLPGQNTYGWGGIAHSPFEQHWMMSTPPTTQEEQPEIETVPETQHQDVESGPSQRKRAHRRKAPEEPREKPTQIPWSSEEQMALARAWLEMTEDPQEVN